MTTRVEPRLNAMSRVAPKEAAMLASLRWARDEAIWGKLPKMKQPIGPRSFGELSWWFVDDHAKPPGTSQLFRETQITKEKMVRVKLIQGFWCNMNPNQRNRRQMLADSTRRGFIIMIKIKILKCFREGLRWQ